MPRYSVATTRNNLSQLIDKAVAGEEVIITRHGKPTATLSVVPRETEAKVDMALRREWLKRLRTFRESVPPTGLTSLDLKRMDQEDYERRFER
jgi:prevent-host-death family protein